MTIEFVSSFGLSPCTRFSSDSRAQTTVDWFSQCSRSLLFSQPTTTEFVRRLLCETHRSEPCCAVLIFLLLATEYRSLFSFCYSIELQFVEQAFSRFPTNKIARIDRQQTHLTVDVSPVCPNDWTRNTDGVSFSSTNHCRRWIDHRRHSQHLRRLNKHWDDRVSTKLTDRQTSWWPWQNSSSLGFLLARWCLSDNVATFLSWLMTIV